MNYQQEALPIPDLSGQSVGDGRFKLVELIGYGSSGTVYRALDTQSDPCDPVYYAIKCLPNKELSRDGLMWQKREIACHYLVSRSSSPNICKLHQIIEEGLYMFCVLDYCPGGDLFTAIQLRTYEGNVTLIKKAFIELLDGVFACHTAGVYHRDLKPENILCMESGSGIRIADFGLATTKLVNREFNVGSWDYMSPECNYEMGSPHYSSLHSDIWSLGVILVNMVSGRSPGWGPAILSDSNFRRYTNNPDFLLDVLPISRSFNEILKRIFHLRESARISLPRLREEILRLDTFYASQAELCNDSEKTRESVRNYARRVAPLTNQNFHVPGYQVDNWPSGFGGAPQTWEYRCSAPALQRPSDTAGVERTPSHSRIYDDGRPLSRYSSSENEGPITPETRPYEPMIDSSDMPGQAGDVYYSLPPPSYIHPSCLCEICLPSLSPKIETGFFLSKIMDTGGIVQAVSTF